VLNRHTRKFRFLSATEKGVTEAIQGAVAWRDDIRRRIGWTDADMSDYVFASLEEDEKVKDAVNGRLNLLSPRDELDCPKDELGWPDRKHLYAAHNTTPFRVHIVCRLKHGGVYKFFKKSPVLSADREDIDRAIEMAVEYREWAREKVRSLKLEAKEAKAKDRADEGGPARGTRAGKRKREQEVPTEDD